MINIKNLSVSFEDKIILENINIDIPAGSTFVIFGKNGSGKSILLKTIAGLIQNYKGSIEINGKDIKDLYAESGGSAGNNLNLSYVFQKGGLFDSMNVFDNIAFPLRRKGYDDTSISESVSGAMARVGLTGNEDKLPSELSGGMQKRVGLARAICVNPDIILYDDPTAGLDPVLSDSIADLIIDIKKSYTSTSIVVTHDLKVAEKISDSVILLYKGRIVYSGLNHDFFNSNDPFARQFIEGSLQGPIDVL